MGFLVLLLALFFLFGLFGLILDKLVKIALPRSVNSILGGLVALCKGLILAALVLMTTTAFISPDSQLFTGSRSWPLLALSGRKPQAMDSLGPQAVGSSTSSNGCRRT